MRKLLVLAALATFGLVSLACSAEAASNFRLGIHGAGITNLTEGQNAAADFFQGIDGVYYDGHHAMVAVAVQTASDQGNYASLTMSYVHKAGSVFRVYAGGGFLAKFPSDFLKQIEEEGQAFDAWGGAVNVGVLFSLAGDDVFIRAGARYGILNNSDDVFGFEVGPSFTLF